MDAKNTTVDVPEAGRTTIAPRDARYEASARRQTYGRSVPLCPKCGRPGEGQSTHRLKDGRKYRWFACAKCTVKRGSTTSPFRFKVFHVGSAPERRRSHPFPI